MSELIQHVYVDGVLYAPGAEVPDDVAKRITNPKAWAEGAAPDTGADGSGQGGSGDPGPFDPAKEGVDEVNNHLAEADAEEVARVLAAEKDGKARKGILEGPYAPSGD